jgi:cyanophycinase
VSSQTKSETTGGYLVIIGGAEDKRNDRLILHRFFELAGGTKSHILILPIASDFPEVAGNVYHNIFTNFGAKKVSVLYGQTRGELLSKKGEKILAGVTGVFMTGGDQMRIATMLGGTSFADALEKRVRRNLVVGGTSAGASAMSSAMIVRGEPSPQPQQDSVRLVSGLGILKNAVIDQHFTERSRLARLITAVTYNPQNLGIGIDENTAVVVDRHGILEVIGSGTVTLVDGSQVGYTNISEVNVDAPFSVFGLRIHILAQGLRYSIMQRKPLEGFYERIATDLQDNAS